MRNPLNGSGVFAALGAAVVLTVAALATAPKALLAQQNCGGSSGEYCQCNNFPPGQICSAHMTCTWSESNCSLSCSYYDCYTP